MQITHVSVDRFRHESAESGSNSYASEILAVSIDSDDGTAGLGFVSTSPVTGRLLKLMVESILARVLVGQDPVSTDSLWTKMQQAIPRRGGDGLMRLAISALDTALWDIKAKKMDTPLWKLLGGRRELVPTYANCAHHLPVDELAQRAASYVAMGHRAMKIRGTRSFVTLDEATARVEAVREAVGPHIRLMVDVNGTWDVDTAIQQLKRWEAYDVYWLEEPVPPHDYKGYQRVRQRSGETYIAGGEQHVGLSEFQCLIDNECVDVLQPNAAMTGGISDWLKIHSLATESGIPVSPWNLQQIHIHMAAGLSNVQWIEYFMADNALLEFQEQLLKGSTLEEVVTDEGVFLKAPIVPGVGIELDQDVADRTRVVGDES